MIKRVALVGLTLAGLAAPAAAAPSLAFGEQTATDVVGTAETGDEAASQPKAARAKRVRRSPLRVSVLPPLRPALDESGEAAAVVAALPNAAPGDIAVAVPDVAPPVAVVADVPATQPNLIAETVVTERAPGRAVAILPPLRPAFEAALLPATTGDGPAPEMTVSAADDVAAPPGQTGKLVRSLPPARPAFPSDAILAASAPEAPPEPPRSLFGSLFSAPVAAATAIAPAMVGVGQSMMGVGRSALNSLISLHARENAVPEDLVHRVVIRESKYNPRAVGQGGALGLMQIKHATARALGYTGPASGLLDADTNLTYAVKYLAGAYRTADGNYDQAVRYYARGYYYAAKSRVTRYASGRRGSRAAVREADASAAQNAADAR